MTDDQRRELDSLMQESGGLLLPERVVEFARDEKTALHAAFTWDDTEAARLWRLEEARTTVRCYVVYHERLQRPVRAMVSVPSDRAHGGGYRPVDNALANPTWQAQLVEEVGQKIRGLRDGYRYLSLLDGLWPQLDALVTNYLNEVHSQREAG